MKISVTRALAQIKSLEDRINKAARDPYISYSVGGKSAGGAAIQEVEATLKANMQSVTDMISQRHALKLAVTNSNSTATVTIAGKTMTVAQALDRKSSIQLEKTLLDSLISQRASAVQRVEQTNVQVQQRLDALVQTAVGKDRKVDAEELDAISTPFVKQNKAELIDPNKIINVIDNLDRSIQEFLLEVDYALSEVNATTMIDVV